MAVTSLNTFPPSWSHLPWRETSVFSRRAAKGASVAGAAGADGPGRTRPVSLGHRRGAGGEHPSKQVSPSNALPPRHLMAAGGEQKTESLAGFSSLWCSFVSPLLYIGTFSILSLKMCPFMYLSTFGYFCVFLPFKHRTSPISFTLMSEDCKSPLSEEKCLEEIFFKRI